MNYNINTKCGFNISGSNRVLMISKFLIITKKKLIIRLFFDDNLNVSSIYSNKGIYCSFEKGILQYISINSKNDKIYFYFDKNCQIRAISRVDNNNALIYKEYLIYDTNGNLESSLFYKRNL